MMNIPTDLLRTLVAIVDLRSFTKAAHALGVTQPAVSAQIKRLQLLLGSELLDKSSPGVALTPRGEAVVSNARRILSINDQIVHLAAPHAAAQMLRVGIPGDFGAARIAGLLGDFRASHAGARVSVRGGHLDELLRGLRQGDLDIVVGMTLAEPAYEPRHWWGEEAVWIHTSAEMDPDGPVPLVSRGDDCPYHQAAVTALYHAGRDCEFTFTAHSFIALQAAVSVGFGTTVMTGSLMRLPYFQQVWSNLKVLDDDSLPRLPKIYCGIFVREGASGLTIIGEVADTIAAVLRDPRPSGLGANDLFAAKAAAE